MNILLTGGAGYIGSHTAVALSQHGHEVFLYDNFCNSRKSVIERLEKILGKRLTCIEGDTRDTVLVTKTLEDFNIDAVIHFAGLKAVGESNQNPIEYYANNVQGTISLLEAMKSTGIKNLIFSSSATVYGIPRYLPIDEDHPKCATNPYGRTKIHIEEMLKDLANSDADWRIVCLRYFNPVGAHESGLIGEESNQMPNNLMPYIAMVVAGERPYLNIYGNDYETKDGTGERDYIHVMDLAEGHLSALSVIKKDTGWMAINLGTGRSHSVMDILRVYEKVAGNSIAYKFQNRRSGDVGKCFASPSKAKVILNWTAKRSIEEMCSSSFDFLKNF